MNSEYLLILTAIMSLLIFIIQRTESGKRRTVIYIMIIPVILIRNWVVYRDVEQEAWAALFLSLFLNFVFWLTIGRYNPVRSSDEIKVLGMDD